MTEFVQERTRRAVDDLTAEHSDHQCAAALALMVVSQRPAPYRLAYTHDARKGPPPVRGGRSSLTHKLMIFETRDAATATHWLMECLLAGLTVTRLGNTDRVVEPSYSILTQREAIAYRDRQTRDPMCIDPDEIPF